MNILIINGPNLNLLGLREPEIYGHETYHDLCIFLESYAQKHGCRVEIRQTNHEGTIIDWLQEEWKTVDAFILNPGAFTHYSYAIRDAIKAIPRPVVEVHLSDLSVREPFRQVSVLKEVCAHQIMGKGFQSYSEAMAWLMKGK
jgi:3-dehydroquinate dehydratase-2